ncbi:hypothetical protein SLS55_003787 [Diplodia seriata]|uniref:Uncharacterized protein n=1 Tax=Diplodia seriata TaxID=420778 RepID=A0ABR3CRL1_9PEZI
MAHFLTMENNSPSQSNPTPEQLQRISAPFAKWNLARMKDEIREFVNEAGLQDDEDYISRGAKLAQDKDAFNRRRDALVYRADLNEKECLERESKNMGKNKFKQTWTLYALVIVCSIGAAVQGWDESAVSSGA